MIDYSEFRCPRKSITEIRKIAAEIRVTHWKGKPLPIDMEMVITKELGLDVIPEPHIAELSKTDAYLQRDCTAIIIDMHQYMDDRDRYSSRLRYAMAHEVGHLVLHRTIYETFEIDSVEKYLEFIENIPENEYNSFEWQANEFAGSLLVPRAMLKPEVQNIAEKILREGIADMLLNYASDILARNLVSLARPFGVSTQVIEIRVQRENLWPPTEYTMN